MPVGGSQYDGARMPSSTRIVSGNIKKIMKLTQPYKQEKDNGITNKKKNIYNFITCVDVQDLL
jgi:hypothetical protein